MLDFAGTLFPTRMTDLYHCSLRQVLGRDPYDAALHQVSETEKATRRQSNKENVAPYASLDEKTIDLDDYEDVCDDTLPTDPLFKPSKSTARMFADLESADESETRPIRFLAPVYSGLAAAFAICAYLFHSFPKLRVDLMDRHLRE
jgi:hypothetical protein